MTAWCAVRHAIVAGLLLLAAAGNGQTLPGQTIRSGAAGAGGGAVEAGEVGGGKGTRTAGNAPQTDGKQAPTVGQQVAFPVVFRISEASLSQLASQQEIKEQEPVSTLVLGTPVRGTAWITGRLRLDLKTDARGAGVEIRFDGTCIAETVGRQGPARIYSTATTTFSARKVLGFDLERGIRAGVATISARTYLPTPRIGSTVPGLRGRIVRCVAGRRVQQRHGQLTRIARHNASTRVEGAFDRATQKLIARYNGDLDLLRPVLERERQENPESVLVFSTTEDHFHLGIGPAGSKRGPELPAEKLDGPPLQLWLHRSAPGMQDRSIDELPARIRKFSRELESRLTDRFDSADDLLRLVRSVPIVVGQTGDWVVVSLEPDRSAQDNQRVLPAPDSARRRSP